MPVSAFLTVTAAAWPARTPDPAGQVPLTRNEIARLFASLLILRTPDTRHRMRWSRWRRRHQQRGGECCRRQAARDP
jgi:hypothetical protein